MPKKSVFAFGARQNADIQKIVTLYKELGGVHCHLQQCYASDVGSQIRPFLEPGVADFVVWRQHSDEKLHQSDPVELARQLINTLKFNNIPIDRVYLHGHNEAGISQKILDWELAFGKEVLRLGGRVVLLNLNPGTPEPEQIVQCKDILLWLIRNRERAKLGLHEYFPVLWDRGKGHLIGRFDNWLKFAGAATTSTRFGPAIFITEFGSDWVDPSWQKTLPKTSGYNDVRGYKSLAKAYEQLLGLPLDEAYWKQCQQAYEQVYQNSVVEAIHLYNWNSRDGKFGAAREAEMDLSNATEFQRLWKVWWKTMQTIDPDIRPLAIDFDNAEPMMVELVDGRVNLRKAPTKESQSLLLINHGDIVRVLTNPLWGKWAAILLQDSNVLEDKRRGFVHTDWIRFHPVQPTNQQPMEPVETGRVAWQSFFTDIELKQIAYALAYSGDFPEPSANYKKLIAKMVSVYEQMT